MRVTNNHAAELEDLLAESIPTAVERERTIFDELAGESARSLVLFGAGPLGRYALEGLRRAGLQPVAFADNNQALWGQRIDGLEVLLPQEAAGRYAESACFVTTIYNGTRARQQLRGLGCHSVAPFAPLFWKYPEVFIPSSCLELPHRILNQAAEIRKGYAVLADDASRTEFKNQLRWRTHLDYGCLPPALNPADMHFAPELIVPIPEEVFVDCGAFDGDSIRSFLAHRDAWRHIYALEPDAISRTALSRYVAELPEPARAKFTVFPYGASSHKEVLGFNVTGTVRSQIATNGPAEPVECWPLDDLLEGIAPTYIKMDIEGAEPDALAGAAKLIRHHRPVLSVCLYHRSEHLWQIPALIHSICQDYQLFIRRYAEECWELVCYAVPQERLQKREASYQ
jgi:FkbM family methyltransferase